MEAYLPTDRGAKFVQSARPTHTYDRLARRSSCLCVCSYNMAASSVRRYSPMHAAPRRGDTQGMAGWPWRHLRHEWDWRAWDGGWGTNHVRSRPVA